MVQNRGALHAVTTQQELARIAERSRRMVRVLDRLIRRAAAARTRDELSAICSEAADLMMRGNHEWRVLLSFQDVRLHV